MDWLTFITKIIDSLIWPLTILLITLIFKEKIKELVPLLKNLKYKDFEMNFGKQITNIEEQVKRARLPEVEEILNKNLNLINSKIISRISEIKDININSPRAAIIESWIMIEQLLRKLAETKSLESINDTSAKILRELFDEQIISHDLFEICDQLRNIRNKAVHNYSFEVDREKSNEYINLSLRVIAALKDRLKS